MPSFIGGARGRKRASHAMNQAGFERERKNGEGLR